MTRHAAPTSRSPRCRRRNSISAGRASGVVTPRVVTPVRRRRAQGSFRWMLLPALGFIALMIGFPLIDTLWLSLQHFSFGSSPRFAALSNYTAILHDAKFWQGLRVTLALYALSLTLQLVTGLYLALLLHRTVLEGAAHAAGVAVRDAAGRGGHDVAGDPRSFARHCDLESWTGRCVSPLWLASPEWVVPTVAMIGHLAMGVVCCADTAGGLADPAAGCVRGRGIDGARGWALLRRVTLPFLAPEHHHRRDVAQRRSVAVLRHHLHHHAGRSRDASQTSISTRSSRGSCSWISATRRR